MRGPCLTLRPTTLAFLTGLVVIPSPASAQESRPVDGDGERAGTLTIEFETTQVSSRAEVLPQRE